MSHQQIEYEMIMRAAGYRVTHQRIAILDAVCAGKGHTTLGEVYARVHKDFPTIDRSTLYRALKVFVALGLVASANDHSGETYYEIANPKHHHLVCRRCGREQQIDTAVVQDLFQRLSDQYGFRVDANHLMFSGLCQNCQTTEHLQADADSDHDLIQVQDATVPHPIYADFR